MLEYALLLVECLEPEGIIPVNGGLLHRNDLAIGVHLAEPGRFNRVDHWVLQEFNHCKGVEVFKSLLLQFHLIVLLLVVQIWQKRAILEVVALAVVDPKVVRWTQGHLNQVGIGPEARHRVDSRLNFTEDVVCLQRERLAGDKKRRVG